MYFRQLASLIPDFLHIDISRAPQSIHVQPDNHALIIVRSGMVTVQDNRKHAALITQGFACHPNHGSFEIEVPKTREAEYAVLSYRMLPGTYPWTMQGVLHAHSEAKINYMLDELIRINKEPQCNTEEEAALQQFRNRLLLERILYIFLYETGMREVGQSSASSIEESLSYMNQHYMLKLTLPLLAQRAGMSTGHYTVLFKARTGMTMTRYLRKLRIEKAKQWLLHSDMSAKDIAQKVGFADYFHFSRIFKQEEGCSPTAFLDNNPKI